MLHLQPVPHSTEKYFSEIARKTVDKFIEVITVAEFEYRERIENSSEEIIKQASSLWDMLTTYNAGFDNNEEELKMDARSRRDKVSTEFAKVNLYNAEAIHDSKRASRTHVTFSTDIVQTRKETTSPSTIISKDIKINETPPEEANEKSALTSILKKSFSEKSAESVNAIQEEQITSVSTTIVELKAKYGQNSSYETDDIKEKKCEGPVEAINIPPEDIKQKDTIKITTSDSVTSTEIVSSLRHMEEIKTCKPAIKEIDMLTVHPTLEGTNNEASSELLSRQELEIQDERRMEMGNIILAIEREDHDIDKQEYLPPKLELAATMEQSSQKTPIIELNPELQDESDLINVLPIRDVTESVAESRKNVTLSDERTQQANDVATTTGAEVQKAINLEISVPTEKQKAFETNTAMQEKQCSETKDSKMNVEVTMESDRQWTFCKAEENSTTEKEQQEQEVVGTVPSKEKELGRETVLEEMKLLPQTEQQYMFAAKMKSVSTKEIKREKVFEADSAKKKEEPLTMERPTTITETKCKIVSQTSLDPIVQEKLNTLATMATETEREIEKQKSLKLAEQKELHRTTKTNLAWEKQELQEVIKPAAKNELHIAKTKSSSGEKQAELEIAMETASKRDLSTSIPTKTLGENESKPQKIVGWTAESGSRIVTQIDQHTVTTRNSSTIQSEKEKTLDPTPQKDVHGAKTIHTRGERETKSQAAMDPAAQNELRKAAEEATAQLAAQAAEGGRRGALLLAMALHLLGQHPEAQERAAKEAAEAERRLLADGAPALTSEALAGAAPYLDAVLAETLRLYPPAPLLTRACEAGRRGGATLRAKGAGLNVAVSLEARDALWLPAGAVQRDPRHWRDPDAFCPRRFSLPDGEGCDAADAAVYLPFGLGPKACAGRDLVLQYAKLVLLTLLPRLEIGVKEGTSASAKKKPHRLPRLAHWRLSLEMEGGVRMAVNRRANTTASASTSSSVFPSANSVRSTNR